MGLPEQKQAFVTGWSSLPGLLGRRHEQAELEYLVRREKPCCAACCGNKTGAPCFCRHAILAALLHRCNIRQILTEPRISVR